MRPGSLYHTQGAPAPAGAGMDPITMGVAAGSGIIQGAMAQNSARESNQFASDMFGKQSYLSQVAADVQMDFQQRMRGSAYQAATDDMRKAGLNPMLAYAQGGAVSPAGASGAPGGSPSGQKADTPEVFGKVISSAIEKMRLDKEIKATDSQIGMNRATEAAARAQAKATLANAKATEAQLPAIEARSRFEEKEAKINESMVELDAVGKRVGGVLNGARDAAITYGMMRSGGGIPIRGAPGNERKGGHNPSAKDDGSGLWKRDGKGWTNRNTGEYRE